MLDEGIGRCGWKTEVRIDNQYPLRGKRFNCSCEIERLIGESPRAAITLAATHLTDGDVEGPCRDYRFSQQKMGSRTGVSPLKEPWAFVGDRIVVRFAYESP